VVKKEVVVASMSSMEAFPTTGIALQLEVPMTGASISGPKVGEECWNSGLDARLEAGDQYPGGGSGGDHVKLFLVVGDPPHGIMGVRPI
jgi:hypothetical protein